MVVVRWPGKAAEHSDCLDFFATFCIKAKSKWFGYGKWQSIRIFYAAGCSVSNLSTE
jgi:hypothetical protein